MRKVVLTGFGGPEVLVPTEAPEPDLPADGWIVELRAIGLNFAELVERRGPRHPLGVVARGEGEHPARPRGQRRDRGPAAARLERSGVLEAFGLHQHAPPGEAVERGVRQQRRAADGALRAGGGGADAVDVHGDSP